MDAQTTEANWRFTKLWTEVQPSVVGFIRSAIADRQSADDIEQEVAMALFKQLDRFDETRPFIAWALGVARNKIADRYRSRVRRGECPFDEGMLNTLQEVASQEHDACDERREALRKCLEHVKGRTWEILKSKYFQGLSTERIACAFKLQEGNVRVLLNRTRKSLRACIERHLQQGGVV